MDRNQVALRLFAALLSRPDTKLDLDPEFGEKQIRTCFMLAQTFLDVANERLHIPPVAPEDVGGLARKGI